MRQSHYVYTAAALTAALAFDGSALADTIVDGPSGVTVAATWRAQPAAIEQGGATTFKLSLRAEGGEGVSGISFADSVFKFTSGTSGSIPTSADMILNGTAPSAGSSANAMLAPLQVTYLESGVHTATVQTTDAGISWTDNGVAQSGSYSLDLGTTVAVGGTSPNIQSASVPLLIGVGESFGFSALADAGLLGSVTYQWDFNFDGTFNADSTEQAPSYAYDTAGVHTGMLRVASDSGYSPLLEFTVNVQGAAQAVPLPPTVWGGLGLMVAFGALRAIACARTAGPRPA
jgi:hypothetical protein